MLISTKGHYVPQVMTDLAEHPKYGLVPLKVLVQWHEISEKYLESIAQLLLRADLPTDLQGKGRLPADRTAGAVFHRGYPTADGEIFGLGGMSGNGCSTLFPQNGVPHYPRPSMTIWIVLILRFNTIQRGRKSRYNLIARSTGREALKCLSRNMRAAGL